MISPIFSATGAPPTGQPFTSASPFTIAKDYDFQIFSDPNQLFEAIKEKNKINNKARVVAGYCWDWNSKKIPSDYDIILPEFHFKKRWNLNTDKNLWIIGDKSIKK